jgi:hypothetical protein
MESKYPMVSVRALERIERLWDHAPILMSTIVPVLQINHRFKFELGWLERAGFHDMVKIVWERPTHAWFPIQRWNNKMCGLSMSQVSVKREAKAFIHH